jgi:hypothetical protein
MRALEGTGGGPISPGNRSGQIRQAEVRLICKRRAILPLLSMRYPLHFNPRQRLAIVPWHPFCRIGRQFIGVSLKLGQLIEGVGAAQFRGVNEPHEQIADLPA